MLGELSFFDELIQDVFDLPSRGRSRVELFQDVLKVGAAVRRVLDVSNEFLFADVRLQSSPYRAPSSLRPHNASLLTSPIEEHRFDSTSRNGGIGRRARFRF